MLKKFFNEALVREIARELHSAHRAFEEPKFVKLATAGLGNLELTERAWQIAEAMHACLPQPFARASEIIEASLGPPIPATGNNGIAPLRYMPHVFYVQKYGLDSYESAIRVQAELTRRFSAESSIRAFIVQYPDRAYEQMLIWAGDGDAHLRRLASEGTRPRLPWAPRLRAFQQDPRPVLQLLELLRDDPVPYVQRSVANNLNDISKDHPDLTIETCRRWSKGAGPERTWIIKHALRTLIKSGNKDAIQILGGAGKPRVRISAIRISPKRARRGESVQLSFDIEGAARTSQRLLVDYAVSFARLRGKSSRKVFKLRTLTIEPRERVTFRATVSLADMTTRKHYPGVHAVEALVNGISHPIGEFRVV